MLDIVINHMGQSMGDVPDLVPFNNETRDYHGCEGCLPDCSVDFDKRYDVNQTQMYTCRLSGLPDLRLEIPEVCSYPPCPLCIYLISFTVSLSRARFSFSILCEGEKRKLRDIQKKSCVEIN